MGEKKQEEKAREQWVGLFLLFSVWDRPWHTKLCLHSKLHLELKND